MYVSTKHSPLLRVLFKNPSKQSCWWAVALLDHLVLIFLLLSVTFQGFIKTTDPPTHRSLTTYPPIHRPLIHRPTDQLLLTSVELEDQILNMFCIL